MKWFSNKDRDRIRDLEIDIERLTLRMETQEQLIWDRIGGMELNHTRRIGDIKKEFIDKSGCNGCKCKGGQ